MSDLPARREVVDFVDYMKTGPQFFTTPASAGELKTLEDLCGKKVGASRSTNWPGQMEELSKSICTGKGKPAMMVIGTEGSVDARTQLEVGTARRGRAGQRDAAVLPEAGAEHDRADRRAVHRRPVGHPGARRPKRSCATR